MTEGEKASRFFRVQQGFASFSGRMLKNLEVAAFLTEDEILGMENSLYKMWMYLETMAREANSRNDVEMMNDHIKVRDMLEKHVRLSS